MARNVVQWFCVSRLCTLQARCLQHLVMSQVQVYSDRVELELCILVMALRLDPIFAVLPIYQRVIVCFYHYNVNALIAITDSAYAVCIHRETISCFIGGGLQHVDIEISAICAPLARLSFSLCSCVCACFGCGFNAQYATFDRRTFRACGTVPSSLLTHCAVF